MPEVDQISTKNRISLSGRSGSPDIQTTYILGGFSGCRKTTLLNSVSLDKIFSPKEVRIGMLPSEASERIAKRRSLTSNFLQSMLFCNAFCIHDIPYMRMQNILPKKCLLHLDLSNVLLNPRLKELVGVDCLKLEDLSSAENIRSHLLQFFGALFFNKFNSISIATMDIPFEVNAARYMNRTGNKFYFKPDMLNLYSQAIREWKQLNKFMPIAVNNIVSEVDGCYVVRQR